MFKIIIEIPDDGSCEKCIFYQECHESYMHCIRFDKLMDNAKPLICCENNLSASKP